MGLFISYWFLEGKLRFKMIAKVFRLVRFCCSDDVLILGYWSTVSQTMGMDLASRTTQSQLIYDLIKKPSHFPPYYDRLTFKQEYQNVQCTIGGSHRASNFYMICRPSEIVSKLQLPTSPYT